jgi:hypothetical protein
MVLDPLRRARLSSPGSWVRAADGDPECVAEPSVKVTDCAWEGTRTGSWWPKDGLPLSPITAGVMARAAAAAALAPKMNSRFMAELLSLRVVLCSLHFSGIGRPAAITRSH